MPAYVVLYTTEVTDETRHAEFRSRMVPLLEAKGGKFLFRGGLSEASDGQPVGNRRIAVMEFPTVEQARAWVGPQSEQEYVALRELREGASTSMSFIVEAS